MATADISDEQFKERRELALWAFPLIIDFAQEQYMAQARLPIHKARITAHNHTHWLRALILGERSNVEKFRTALDRSLLNAAVPVSLVTELNDALLDELMIVVSERFQRSPRRALELNQILLKLARELTAISLSRELRV